MAGKCSIDAFEPGLVNTATTLTANPTTTAFGTSVTFTASVSGVRGGAPPDSAATVTFENGTTTLGTRDLVGGKATFAISSLSPGNSVTATYTAGGAGNLYGASPAPNAVSVTITRLSCVVTSTQDPTEGGKLTLRDAVNTANAGGCTSNTITFDPTLFATAHTITLTNGTLALNHDVTIDGTGRQVVLDGGCATNNTCNGGYGGGGAAVFTINGGTVTLRVLTIQHGSSVFGGGIDNEGGRLTVTGSTVASNSAVEGGGIFNRGTLTVTDSTIANNFGLDDGGSILNYGTATVTNSTIANNGTSYGGGIYNSYGAALTVTNSTFTSNSAATGGGIWNDGGTVTVTNSTIAANSTDQGGGIDNNSGTTTVTNTILAGNAGGDVYKSGGTITDGGHNLVSDGSLAGGAGDTTGPALLAPLGSYGGATQTAALLPGSAAIGGGDPAVCASTTVPAAAPVGGKDERGVSRPPASCDIGAFQSQGFTFSAPGGSPQSTHTGTAFAAPLTLTVSSNHNEPVVGGVVTFTAPATGASITAAPITAPITGTAGASSGAVSQSVTANATSVVPTPWSPVPPARP